MKEAQKRHEALQNIGSDEDVVEKALVISKDLSTCEALLKLWSKVQSSGPSPQAKRDLQFLRDWASMDRFREEVPEGREIGQFWHHLYYKVLGRSGKECNIRQLFALCASPATLKRVFPHVEMPVRFASDLIADSFRAALERSDFACVRLHTELAKDSIIITPQLRHSMSCANVLGEVVEKQGGLAEAGIPVSRAQSAGKDAAGIPVSRAQSAGQDAAGIPVSRVQSAITLDREALRSAIAAVGSSTFASSIAGWMRICEEVVGEADCYAQVDDDAARKCRDLQSGDPSA